LESAPQETDYSLTGMFQSAHGVFMRERGRFEPMARFDLGSFPNQSIHHEPGSFDLLRAGFDANLPLVLSSEGYLKIGAYGHVRRYRMDNITTVSPVGELHDETLHAAGIKLGFGAFLDENLLLEVETHPGVWSDADAGLHHQDYDVPSHALLTVRAHEDLYWKVGARYNQTFKNAPWLPYLGVSWDITGMITPEGGDYGTGAWRLDVLLPEYIELSFWPTADTGFQLGTEIDGAEYHVRTSAATGNQRDNLRVQEFTAYLGMTHRMSDNFSFSAKAGAVIGGDYELTNGSSGFNIVEGSLSQGFFGSVSFGIDW
ncbi:MAG: hypothetical protein KDC98_23615, partial [Planctomycetes bacterium]|nr:hypothetical protein [Planctomycetota bacterium]